MLSSADKVVPLSSAPRMPRSPTQPRTAAVPGLQSQAIQGLQPLYPGTLTKEMRALLQENCGLWAPEFGTIDFTGRWHPQESIQVLRPSVTLAIDDDGRRWIGETSRQQGLPGPIWCVLPEPAVALYVTDDLEAFLHILNESLRQGQVAKWLHALEHQARAVWANRQALARQSYEACRADPALRDWLMGLPGDAQVYDLRAPTAARGWPYGLAGPNGRFYRCGQQPIFAVANFPSASRWSRHMAEIAGTRELIWPAAVTARAA
jgi:hypothetical protein